MLAAAGRELRTMARDHVTFVIRLVFSLYILNQYYIVHSLLRPTDSRQAVLTTTGTANRWKSRQLNDSDGLVKTEFIARRRSTRKIIYHGKTGGQKSDIIAKI